MNYIDHDMNEIVIADDNPANLKLLTTILSDACYKVRSASDGELALRSIRAKPPDIVLLDVKMPVMDGYEVCLLLKADKQVKDIPVIFISVLEDEYAKQKGFDAGCVDFIHKPFYSSEVLSRVKTHLFLRRMQLELKCRNTELIEIQKKLEAELVERRKAEDSLANEKERLMVTLRSIGDGVITTDTRGRVVLINTIAENLTGWRQNDATGNHISEVFKIINEQTRQACENPVEKVIRSGTIVDITNNTILVTRYGTERIIEDSGSPIRDHDGNIIGVVLAFRDITQKLLIEAELQQTKKLESIGTLAGGIAHDFNNMLGIISGNISYALSQINQNDNLFEILTDAQKGTKQAQNLTQQLLTFAKGGAPIKKEADINELLKESAIFVTRGSKVRCEFKFPEDLWSVQIDINQIKQAINNLIINSLQAMPEGGIIKIQTENIKNEVKDSFLLKSSCYVKIIVKDEGIGISEKHISKIFDPYFTTKQKGSGLGLAITHSIIKRHNGHITVESKIDKGTIFNIYLPALETNSKVVEKQAKIEEHKGHGKILIMDDEKMILDVYRRLLNFMGYETFFATDGEQSIKIYEEAFKSKHPFDLVILDLTVPGGMGGAKTIPELLKIDPKVKAVVSSGYSNDPVMADYQDHGFCGIITKPFTKDEIAEVLNKILGKKEII